MLHSKAAEIDAQRIKKIVALYGDATIELTKLAEDLRGAGRIPDIKPLEPLLIILEYGITAGVNMRELLRRKD